MENHSLKILLISSDADSSRRVGELVNTSLPNANVTMTPTADGALALLATNFFDAALFDAPQANSAALFQITSLTTRAPRTPLLVIGPNEDENFLTEAVSSGAEDYLGRDPAQSLQHAIVSAIARHQEKISLLDEKENYHSIFDHLVEGIFRTTPDGHYLLANVALARIYGYDSPVELMASIKDIANRLYVQPGRRADFVRQMQLSDTLTGFESQIFRKDGSVIWISENCRAVRDAQEKLLYYEGTVEDITRQKQIEEALRRSESLYHSLVETMPQGVFRRDLEGRFTFANQTYCKYHGAKVEDLIGKSDFDLYPKEAAEKYWHDDLQLMEKGEAIEVIEESQPIGTTEKQYHHVLKTPLRDENGKVIGLQGMFWDITEEKRAEEKIRQTTAELARSREELRAKNSLMEENLRVAADIQLTMLPQQYPVFPTGVPPEQSAFQFVHRYQPAEGVSGDFFNVSAISDTEASVLICDVTGHGIRAALVTAMIRALAEELKPLAREPGNFLRKLNFDLSSILKNTGSPMLTTAFYLVANAENGALRFANAGHPKPLRLRREQNLVEPLANASGKGQPALGLFEDSTYETTEMKLLPGDFLMLFTDGIYEVQGQNEELYSQQRLLLDVKSLMQHPPGEMFDELIDAIRTFAVGNEFDDDVCLVGIEFTGKNGKE